MGIARNTLRWNGWGWIDAPDVLGEKAAAVWQWMADTFGLDALPETPGLPLERIALPAATLDTRVLAELAGLAAPERVKTDDYERAFHARGQSYYDLIHLRAGKIDRAPDAVVYPEDAAEVQALVEFAVQEKLTLIPFGGGSSVVGGVNACAAAGQQGILTLDMTLMDKLLEIDEESLVARAQAGIYGPALEDALAAQGYTLGHYPQSFEFSTLGGWIAPRGAGHQSNKYGKADSWFVGAEVATPQGLWQTERFPGSAAGPQMRDLIAGSEGVLGVITEASFKVHPVPEVKDYRGYIFMDFASGVAATRALMQQRVPTAMIRLSDEDETRFYTALKMGGEAPDASVRFCAMLVGLEGTKEHVAAALVQSRAIIEAAGGVHMGESLGEGWYETRFENPYLRDPMLDRGLGVDTLETCTHWSNLHALREATVQAIRRAMAQHPGQGSGEGIVMSHVSHCYVDGASLYFTFAFPRDLDDETGQWWAIKEAASDAIVQHGGTISHHHGVGTDHLRWMEAEKGPLGIATLRAAKKELDPTAVLNPGKLLP